MSFKLAPFVTDGEVLPFALKLGMHHLSQLDATTQKGTFAKTKVPFPQSVEFAWIQQSKPKSAEKILCVIEFHNTERLTKSRQTT